MILPKPKGRHLLLHEDNQYVTCVLTHLISKPSTMMYELRKLFLVIDTYNIKIRTQYIRSASNVWADNLSRVTNNSDSQLAPRKLKHFNNKWGPHTVYRFTSYANKQLSRYNAMWRDGSTEAVDSLHLTGAEWRRERDRCNLPWEMLDDLVFKLRKL